MTRRALWLLDALPRPPVRYVTRDGWIVLFPMSRLPTLPGVPCPAPRTP